MRRLTIPAVVLVIALAVIGVRKFDPRFLRGCDSLTSDAVLAEISRVTYGSGPQTAEERLATIQRMRDWTYGLEPSCLKLNYQYWLDGEENYVRDADAVEKKRASILKPD